MEKIIARREVRIDSSLFNTDLHPLLQRIYIGRGIQCSTELERGLNQLLPFEKLSNIQVAVDCLVQSLQQEEHIMIIGDFDADGATSTAVAVSALKSFGAKRISYLVPNRFKFGYGLTPQIVHEAAQQKPDLIITVDNGIASHEGVNAAKALNMKVIITDHHLPGQSLPAADAIVNPNLSDDPFESKHLAGVGVIFYVMLALRSALRSIDWFTKQGIPEPIMSQWLDLVALGTVADVVTLDKNNRILVHQGLQRIRQGKACPGIQALLEVAGKSCLQLSSSDLGFSVAPRLNAAGRLDDMSLGIACLLAEEFQLARQMAVQLDLLNKERQAIEAEMRDQAFDILSRLQLHKDLPLGLCLFDENWHQGVVGIVASRIKDLLCRPVIAFAAVDNEELKGSARSVAGLHIRDVFETITLQNPGLIEKFGGHAMAAGLSIHRKHLVAFSEAFDAAVRHVLKDEQLQGIIHTDGELTHQDFSLATVELLRFEGPWGQGFPEPLFDGHFTVIQQRLLKNKHLKLTLELDDHLSRIDAIAFNIDSQQWPNAHCNKIRAAYKLDINEYLGRRSVQLLIEHLEAL